MSTVTPIRRRTLTVLLALVAALGMTALPGANPAAQANHDDHDGSGTPEPGTHEAAPVPPVPVALKAVCDDMQWRLTSSYDPTRGISDVHHGHFGTNFGRFLQCTDLPIPGGYYMTEMSTFDVNGSLDGQSDPLADPYDPDAAPASHGASLAGRIWSHSGSSSDSWLTRYSCGVGGVNANKLDLTLEWRQWLFGEVEGSIQDCDDPRTQSWMKFDGTTAALTVWGQIAWEDGVNWSNESQMYLPDCFYGELVGLWGGDMDGAVYFYDVGDFLDPRTGMPGDAESCDPGPGDHPASEVFGAAEEALPPRGEVGEVFAFTGGPQTYAVPSGVTMLEVVMAGASWAPIFGDYNQRFGGGYASATVPVAPGESLSVYVGGVGRSSSGGFNGGGPPGAGSLIANGGSGASDIRRGTTKLLVAGGAGGPGEGAPFLYGGRGGLACAGTPGGDGGTTPFGFGVDGARGRGATPTAGGAGGTGVVPSSNGTAGTLSQGGTGGPGSRAGGGGGGGYYGGGGGGGVDGDIVGWVTGVTGGGGGGGSCYAHPSVENPVLIPGAHAGILAGVYTGNGFVSITPVGA